jgi:hypothetical protein
MAALLAALLPVDRLIEPDRAGGVLDQLAVRGLSEEAGGDRQAGRPLAELRATAAARRGPGGGVDEAAAGGVPAPGARGFWSARRGWRR